MREARTVFLKLSLRNVKRSYQDNVIYFMTLILAVNVFYMFNSLACQEYLATVLYASTIDSIATVKRLIVYLWVFISIIFGFLIMYMNHFLFKRRKQELAIYLTLGMERRTISGILLFETLIIGILSLGIGIGIGVPLSQVLSYITQFSFVFSWAVVGRTVLYFGVVFLVTRYRIISLIQAQKEQQKLNFTFSFISLVSFILAVGVLGVSYRIVLNQNADYYIFRESHLLFVFVLGIMGTSLLFLSLAGYLMVMIE